MKLSFEQISYNNSFDFEVSQKSNSVFKENTLYDFSDKEDKIKTLLLTDNKITFSGNITRKDEFSVLCKSLLEGCIDHTCNTCGTDIRIYIKDNLNLIFYNGEYKSSGILEDIIEIYDGIIDIDEILYGEIQSIKSDYISCKTCNPSILTQYNYITDVLSYECLK